MSEGNEKDRRSTEVAVPAEADTGEGKSERQISFTRRALVHAGWAVPVVLAVKPPVAFAQSPPPGSHSDTTFNDITPQHNDGPDHLDNGLHIDT